MKKNKISVLSFLLTIVLTFCLVCSAFAANTTLSFSSAEGKAGDTVTMPLKISNNAGIAGLQISLSYDTSVLSVSATKGTLFSGFTAGKNFLWDESENVTANGTLATFSFKIAETATPGDYPVQIIVRSCTNTDYDDVACSVVNGTITVLSNVCQHKNVKTVAGKAATCTAAGLTDGKQCTDCGVWTVPQTTIAKLGHDYSVTKSAKVNPTCTTAGKEAVKQCSRCTVTTGGATIAATGHTETTLNAVAATCTTAGKTEGKKCSVCNTVTVAQTTIAKLGHDYSITKSAKVNPTCTKEGKEAVKQCSRCTATTGGAVIATIPHTYVNTVIAPTCITEGYTTHTCSVCGNSYTDSVTTMIAHADNNGDSLCDVCGIDMATAPAAVTGFKLTHYAATTASLSWTKVDDATSYEIYTYNADNGTYKKIGSTTKTSTTVDNLKEHTSYELSIRAVKTIGATNLYSDYAPTIGFKTLVFDFEENLRVNVKANLRSSYSSSSTKITSVPEGVLVTSKGEKIGEYTYVTYDAAAYGYGDQVYTGWLLTSALERHSTSYDPAEVTGLKVTNTAKDSVTLSWNAVDSANGYDVCEYSDTTGAYTFVQTVSGTSCTIKGLKPSTTHKYVVWSTRTTDDDIYFSYDPSNMVTVKTLTDSMTYVTSEKVNMRAKASSSASLVVSVPKGAKVTSTGKTSGDYMYVTYKTSSKTYNGWVMKKYLTHTHTYSNTVTKATLTKNGKITSMCTECGSTKSSTIYFPKTFTAADKAYTGKALATTLTITDSNGKVIDAKYYTVTYSNNTKMGTATAKITFKTNYSGTKSVTFKIVPAQVTCLKQTKVTATTFALSWGKVTGAKYYKLERSTDGKTWTTVTTTDKVTYTVTGLKAGTKYQFRVTALDSSKKIAGKASAVLKTQTLCVAPTIKLSSTKSKTATVSWSKVTGATGYVVWYSKDNKNWTKKTVTGTSYTITGLTGGKKVYVKVQATNSYKLNGAFCAVKSITVKK